MVDEPRPDPDRRDNSAVHEAIEALRTDVREDIGHLRDDVREDLAASEGRLTKMVTDFITLHGRDHAAQRTESEVAHARFDTFIRAAELAQARRDGILGMFRFALELISRHAKPIATIILALTGAALALSGAVSVSIR